MPALDQCHPQVVQSLRKDGWNVNEKPKYLYDVDTDSFIFIDIEALQQTNGTSSQNRSIYVEVKCFPGHHITQEIYTALGQYMIYRAFLRHVEIETPLYLAIPATIYDNQFNAIVRESCYANGIKLLVVDLDTETIIRWVE